MKIKVLDLSFPEEVSVTVNGECNHYDHSVYYIDEDGEEFEQPKSEAQWYQEQLVCNTCGAEYDSFDKQWRGGQHVFDRMMDTIRAANKHFDDIQRGKA